MPATSYFAKCFSCSAEVGKILHGRFLRHNCPNPLPRPNGRPRCCHCGGSLYLEPDMDGLPETDEVLIREAIEQSA